jgi:hypothetical protein
MHHVLLAAMQFDTAVKSEVALPLLQAAKYLIPAGVALAGLHKLLSHQETGASFLVELLTKAGGAILLITLFQNVLA